MSVYEPAKTKVTLKCEVFGNPPPLCMWWTRKGDNEEWKPVGEAEQSFVIRSLHVLNEGQYCCVAANKVGKVWSNIAVVCLEPRECGMLVASSSGIFLTFFGRSKVCG